MATVRKGNCWPDVNQQLLLKAALAPKEVAADALAAWVAAIDFEALDTGSYRLLPLLYDHLQSLSLPVPQEDRLKGILRHSFVRNQLHIRSFAKALGSLSAAGIDLVVTADAALVSQVYSSPALRPHNHFGLLVRPDNVSETRRVLATDGWTALHESTVFPESARSTRGVTVTDSADQKLEIQWRSFDDVGPEADQMLWTRKMATRVFDMEANIPDPADQLIHIMHTGIRWNDVPPFRWMADATLLVRRWSIDWDYFLARASAVRMIPAVRDGLNYLAGLELVDVPEEVDAILNRSVVSRAQEAIHRLTTSPPPRTATTMRWRTLRIAYMLSTDRAPSLFRVAEFLGFLRIRWGLESTPAVIRSAARKLFVQRGP